MFLNPRILSLLPKHDGLHVGSTRVDVFSISLSRSLTSTRSKVSLDYFYVRVREKYAPRHREPLSPRSRHTLKS